MQTLIKTRSEQIAESAENANIRQWHRETAATLRRKWNASPSDFAVAEFETLRREGKRPEAAARALIDRRIERDLAEIEALVDAILVEIGEKGLL